MQIDVTLIGQMITFALFVWFTMKLVWPPIMKALAARQKKIAEGLAASERAEHELELARHKGKEIVQEAKAQAVAIIEQANQRAHKMDEDAQVHAREVAIKIRAAAEADIAHQFQMAQAELKTQVANLAIACAEKIVQRHVDRAANEDIIQQLVGEMSR